MTRPRDDAESDEAEYLEWWCNYDRKATHFLAFPTLAAALTCLEKLTKCAT
ncbi:hypothetical protein IU427_22395 [Nocardia beijingensis]|uniref:hypothetical protein n=1 Tax=Nocardia beijingensis TaxID=95162 RepID=UPI0018953C0D|nr:hypothetical protein [Nocardia beijingensis]MBF6467917.1 hypothetical protein [Nocardia beijingensis]